MPVAILREDGAGGFAPVARPRFLLGKDLDCDLVDTSAGVASHHATVRYRRGEYLLKAEEGCSFWAGTERMPLLALRDGDAFRFAPDAPEWTFRSRVEGTFWPPELQLGEAWLSHPAYPDPEHGPARFGSGPALGGSGPFQATLASTAVGAWVVKQLGPVEEPIQANEHLRLLAALGGAPHPALAPLVDGGIAPREGVPWRWMATRLVEGACAEQLVQPATLGARRVRAILGAIAEALQHLHHRGVVHRKVAPDSVVVSPRAPAVLIDYGHAWSAENGLPRSWDLSGMPGYAAPEVAAGGRESLSTAVDVYGLAATGFGLLVGTPPQRHADPRAALEGVREGQPARWDLDAEATAGLLDLLVGGLAFDAARRPDVATCRRALAEPRVGAGVRR